MKKSEIEVLRHLEAVGLPGKAVRSRMNWTQVRARIDAGVSPKDVANEQLNALATSTLTQPVILATVPPLPLPLGQAGEVVEVAGRLIDLIRPAQQPLAEGFETQVDLQNCKVQYLGQVAEGDYMKIEVSDNGDTLPFDDPGEVEIITEPGLPAPPGGSAADNKISGDGSVNVVGPRTVWVHLRGSEDAASVTATIYSTSR